MTGVSSLWFGLFGNLIVIACTLFVGYRVREVSTVATGLIARTGYATVIVLGQLRAQGLL